MGHGRQLSVGIVGVALFLGGCTAQSASAASE